MSPPLLAVVIGGSVGCVSYWSAYLILVFLENGKPIVKLHN